MFSTIEDAIQDVKTGKVIIIVDDVDRENEGDFYVATEFATPENINFMITEGRGLLCTTIEEELAQNLDLYDMVPNNRDNHNTAFTISIDHNDTHTGISAYERSYTIRKMIQKSAVPSDFRRPGHIFPLKARKHGLMERAGHTEASVELSKLAGLHPSGVICEVIKEDGEMARRDDLFQIAKRMDLKVITIKDLKIYLQKHVHKMEKSLEAILPTEFGDFKMVIYRDAFSGLEHAALIKEDKQSNKVPLVRVHSECLTGDVFHSKKCDCGDQLHESMKKISKYGYGAIIYLRQEGRGIGLFNKINAYNLQDQGRDTIEANLELGFDEDLREYTAAYHILENLGLHKIKLLTNNPLKINGLKDLGIDVIDRVSINSDVNKYNERYMKTKVEKMNHLINLSY